MESVNSSLPPKIINNSYFSIGFPEKDWHRLISRENYISQMKSLLQNEVDLIFIEGEEDVGKTTLCGQFAMQNMGNTITVFFNPLNNLDYQIEFYCSNVSYQILNMLGEAELSEQSLVSIDEYQANIFNLRKQLKRRTEKIYLIIDGLENKSYEDPEFVIKLFSILPRGYDSIGIIISGSKSDFVKNVNSLQNNERVKSISIAGFSRLEIASFLEIVDDGSSLFGELYNITKGYPGRLETLKRLIDNEGYSLDKITKSTSYTTWIEMDCESIDLNSNKVNGLLSLLTLTDASYTLEEIALIVKIEKNEIRNIVNGISVLEIKSDKVLLVSGAHKKYLANQLRTNKKKVQELLIDYYANSDSFDKLVELPRLFADLNQWANVIGVLDDEALPKILENTGSLKIVTDCISLGIEASQELNRHNDLWKFSIQGSIVNELDNFTFWESEIEALIAIDDFASAIKLAESAVLKIDRLRLLALIARRQKELSNSVDEELIHLITNLYETTDLTAVGNKIYDIVSDLIYSIPNLAIELIEKSSGSASESNINDWVIAKLSTAAIESNIRDNGNLDDNKKLEAVQKLNAPLVKKINKAITFLVGNYTPSKVLDEVNKLSDSKERLRLLRLWLNNHRSNVPKVENVISKALDDLIESTSKDSYALDVLKDLSYQLPYVKDVTVRKELLKRFRQLEYDLSELGLTKNKYIYLLNVFHTVHSFDQIEATKLINSILSEIDSLDDTLMKLDSFAEVYAKLKTIKGVYSDKSKFVYSRFLSLSADLFKLTANHYKITQSLLATIGKKNPILALKISEQINTFKRRERAKHLILDSYLDNNLKFVKIELLKELLNSFKEKASVDDAIIRILDRYSEAKSLHYSTIEELLYFIDKTRRITNSYLKSFALVTSYKVISKNDSWKNKLSERIKNQLYASWSSLDAEWDKIDIGFKICSQLSRIDLDFSRRIFDESNELKSNSWLDSKLIAHTYLLSISLIIKAYTSLLISDNDKNNDYKILENCIAQIPSKADRIRSWTELGFFSYLCKREDISRKVVENHIIPLIQDQIDNKNDIDEALESLTLIYIYNSEIIPDYVNKLSTDNQEEAYLRICEFLTTKRNPFEIYEDIPTKYNTTFNDLTKAIKVLSKLKTDSIIYHELSNICGAITNNKTPITNAQKGTLVLELQKAIENKLPDTQNIVHEGYQILCELGIGLLNKRNINNKTFWQQLIDRADQIPNVSDVVFVKSVLIRDIPFDKIENGNEVKSKVFDDIIKSLNDLPSHYEYVQRVIDITDIMYSVNRTRWKEIVNRAFNTSSELEDSSEAFESKRNIVDSMYRLDPDYAKSLVKLIDKDKTNSSGAVSRFLNEHCETLEISEKIKNSKTLTDREIENNRKVVRAVIEALRSLNSDKLVTKKVTEISQYLTIGRNLPMHEVFPIYLYYLGNCAKTYKSKNLEGTVSDLHRKNFEEIVKSTNLIQILSHKKKTSGKESKKFFVDENFSDNKALNPGSREEAISFIRSWLSDEVEDFVIIADPYFGKYDLEILKYLKEVDQTLEIDILGSKNGIKSNTEEEFRKYWEKISDENPPFTNITFCWVPDKENDTPFHDRWILTKNGGIRLGTSVSSLGVNKESEISVMKPSEALNIKEKVLMDYINRKKRETNNMRISYRSFSL